MAAPTLFQTPLAARNDARPCRAVQVDIVVPVYNEQAGLERSIRRLHRFLEAEFPFTLADRHRRQREHGRHAGDRPRARRRRSPACRCCASSDKGRGRALRAAWSASDARVVAYMDVDLSTDLRGLLPLVAPLLSGHSDLAIGTRLARGARVVRGPKRELISRAYNVLLHTALRARFSDAQCGFKAVRREALRRCWRRCATMRGSSTPNCSCWPSAAGCGSTRCPSTGSTTRTRASRSCARRSTTCAASRG